jgi:hypothetical protein
MRVLRTAGAVLLGVVATVLMILSIVLCITLILLPVGIPLAFLSIRLYAVAAKLLLPRTKDVQRGFRKGFRVDEFSKALHRADRRVDHAWKRLHRRSRRLRKRLAA